MRADDRLDVVTFGEILWDIYERPPSAFERQLGGAPANVATGLARLGMRAAVLGGVGRDRFGDALVAHLAEDGVDTRFVVRLANRTGITFIARGARGEPSFLFYRHDSADMAVSARHVLGVPALRCRWALVGTSTLMTPGLARATYAFLDAAERRGARVFVDLNVRAHLWRSRREMERAITALARRAAVVKASDADLEAIARTRGSAWLAKSAPGATWLVTRGARGASAIGEHGEVTLPSLRVRCVDATGAGDAFIAGSLAVLVRAGATPGTRAWSDPEVWARALRVGHAMGAKAVSRVGAVSGLLQLERLKRML